MSADRHTLPGASASGAVGRARAQRILVIPLPSGGLVAALGEFGIAPANARATLSRLTQRGIL